MILGQNLWHDSILENMAPIEIGERLLFTYLAAPQNCYAMLVTTALTQPNKIGFFDDNGCAYRYAHFLELVDKFAHYLKHTKQINKGKHIGLLLYNSIEFCVAFYAIAKLAAVAVPLPSKYTQQELSELIQKSDLDLLIIHEHFNLYFTERVTPQQRVVVQEDKRGCGLRYLIDPIKLDERDSVSLAEPNDVIIIMFTSGTTSQSKGVVLRNYNVIHAIMTYQRILAITPQDKTIIPIPIYHITGLVGLLGLFVYVGGEIYLHRYYCAEKILACIEKNKITFMHGSPTVFAKLLELKDRHYHLNSLKMIGCGSSYTPLSQQQDFHKWLPNTQFRVIYGMTETASPAFIFPNDTPTSIYATASGRPVPGLEVKILDEQGQELAQDQIGEIWLRGSSVCDQYYKLDTQMITPDKWLNTGDMGYFNGDNYIYVVDRKKDMINRGGEKIWSIDVEQALLLLPDIKECAVVAIPDEIYGEVAAAMVVVKTGRQLTACEIQQQLRKSLASFKIPVTILFSDAIPKTAGLKVDKRTIKARLTQLG